MLLILIRRKRSGGELVDCGIKNLKDISLVDQGNMNLFQLLLPEGSGPIPEVLQYRANP